MNTSNFLQMAIISAKNINIANNIVVLGRGKMAIKNVDKL